MYSKLLQRLSGVVKPWCWLADFESSPCFPAVENLSHLVFVDIKAITALTNIITSFCSSGNSNEKAQRKKMGYWLPAQPTGQDVPGISERCSPQAGQDLGSE